MHVVSLSFSLFCLPGSLYVLPGAFPPCYRRGCRGKYFHHPREVRGHWDRLLDCIILFLQSRSTHTRSSHPIYHWCPRLTRVMRLLRLCVSCYHAFYFVMRFMLSCALCYHVFRVITTLCFVVRFALSYVPCYHAFHAIISSRSPPVYR